MRKESELFKIVLSSIFLALAYVLPFLTGQIPEIGSMLCPMHIPVLLCGFICGWKYGLIVGIIAPIFRSLTLGMPPLFPTALAMAFELGTYGLISGILYNVFIKNKKNTYIILLLSMLAGRIVWGIVMFVCMGINHTTFTFYAFLSGSIINAFPGIIIQILLIPLIVFKWEKLEYFNNGKIGKN